MLISGAKWLSIGYRINNEYNQNNDYGSGVCRALLHNWQGDRQRHSFLIRIYRRLTEIMTCGAMDAALTNSLMISLLSLFIMGIATAYKQAYQDIKDLEQVICFSKRRRN